MNQNQFNEQKEKDKIIEQLKENRNNELIDFLLNVGEIIKFHRIKQGLRIEDVSRKVLEKYNVEIHPSILSRYENKKLPIKNHHIAYLLDVLDIYLETIFSHKIVMVELKGLTANLKFQYLVKQLRNFFTDAEILNIILLELESRLNYSWKAVEAYIKKQQFKLNVSENNQTST